MSKIFHHFYRKHKLAILLTLGVSGITIFTAYAIDSNEIRKTIERIAGGYYNVDGAKQYYDGIANNSTMDNTGKRAYYSSIAEVHRGVASVHNRIADYADERFRSLGGELPTSTGGTNTGGTNTGGVLEPIGNQHLQVQFYGVPYTANGKGTLTRGRDYDGYYGLSNKIREDGPFVCKAWYSTNKSKSLGREITFRTENGVTNTSEKKTDTLVMKIDFAADVTETLLKVTCSGTMGGSWKTLEYVETFNVTSPARAKIDEFSVSNNNPNPNESLTFTWKTTGAVGCSIMQYADGGVRFSLPGQQANGSYVRNADSTGNSIYRLVCTNQVGEDVSSPDLLITIKGAGGSTGSSLPTCGSANGQSSPSAPNTNLCGNSSIPSPSPAAVDPANPNKWKWTCSLGSNQVSCSANKTTTNQTGSTNTAQCGSANNGTFSTAPTYNLCIQSTNPSAPTLSASTNKWNWVCVNGTQDVSCSANFVSPNSSIQCGTSNNGTFATAPNTNLCIQSSPNPAVPVWNTATSKWAWNCTSGTQSIPCSASRPTNTQTGVTLTGGTNGPKCGAVHNGLYISAPTNYLCDTGTPQPTIPTLDTATNKWKWTCTGSGQSVNCSAGKGDPTTILGQYAFSPRCSDSESFISLGGMAATIGNQNISTNYSPTQICKIPTNIPSNIFNYLTDLVEPIDMNGTDGYFDWGCMGISQNGTVDGGSMVTCRAKRVIDAQCGPYTNVPRAAFDELTPGIRGGPVPEALKRSYCTVGEPMHEVDERRLDSENFGLFHWRCVSPDYLAKSCSAPYQQVKTINLSASSTSISAGQNVTFTWSLPTNTAFVKCYPVYDYRAQGNAVYDFYNGSKGLQGSFSAPFNTTTVVSLYCTGRSNDVSGQKDVVITVGGGNPPPVSCPSGSTTLKSADQQNTCNFAWAQTAAGQSANAVTTTGGGVLNGRCGTDGSWSEWAVSCPNKTTAVSCPGGGATFYSNDQSNRCVASLSQSSVGTVVRVGAGLTVETTGPAATGSATCKPTGSWSYQINCPSANTAVKTCPGGSEQLPSPNGSKTCVASWGITNANSWADSDRGTINITNGGKLRAYCNANGDWDENTVTWSCPN